MLDLVRDPCPPLPLVYRRVTAPAALPLDRTRACRHLRLDEVDLDDVEGELVDAAITAAVEHLDGRAGILGRALITQSWQATTDRPAWSVLGLRSPPGFLLDLPPIQAVTKVECLVGGAYQLVDPALYRVVARPGGKMAVTAAGWPSADRDPEAWRLTFTAGYGATATDVPAPIRHAILMMVSDLYDNRDAKQQANLVDNPTVDRLLAPYRAVGV